MVAEQFGEAIEMEAITRAAKYGRVTGKNNSWVTWWFNCGFSGTCHRMECPIMDGQLRTVTDYLAGFEELLGHVFNSVSTSIGK